MNELLALLIIYILRSMLEGLWDIMNKNILERALNKNLENWGNAITTVTGANIVSAHFHLYLPSAQ